MDATATVTVSAVDDYVNVTQLLGAVVTGTELLSTPAGIAIGADSEVVASVELKHNFKNELDQGQIWVWAHFTDGSTRYIRNDDGLEISVAVNSTGDLAVTKNVNGTSDFQLTVPLKATSVDSLVDGSLLNPTWTPKDSQTPYNVPGIIPTLVDLAVPVSAEFTASTNRITRRGDGASEQPIAIPVTAELTYTINYDDGSSKNFILDDRANFTISTGEDLADVVDGVVVPKTDADGVGTITITASLPEYAPELGTASVSMTLVILKDVDIITNPYPTYSGSSSYETTTLHKVACTDYYQSIEATLTATLSDGSVYDISKYGSYDTSDASVGTVYGADRDGWRVQALEPTLSWISSGTFAMASSFGSGEKAFAVSQTITVTDTRISVTSISHVTQWDSGNSFVGYYMASKEVD